MCFTCQQEMFYLGRAQSNQTLISRIMHRSIAPSIATKEPGTVDTADGWLAKLKYLHFKSELLIQDLHKKRTKLFYVLYNSMPIVIQIHIQGAEQCQCPRSGQVSLLCTSPILTSIYSQRRMAFSLLKATTVVLSHLKNSLRHCYKHGVSWDPCTPRSSLMIYERF